jgi:dihydropteroate synthase
MGILNVTPDSFSDGGQFADIEAAVAQAHQMQREGAALIDIGGESTRPGARPVNVQEELDRVIPVIEALSCELDIPLSIDTCKPGVMREAVAAGAGLINDVMALQAPGVTPVSGCGRRHQELSCRADRCLHKGRNSSGSDTDRSWIRVW